MKNYFVLLILILSSNLYAQKIEGTWKVISYQDDKIYFNKVTDSISVLNQTLDADKIKGLKEMLEKMAFQVTYSFDKKGKSVINFPGKANIVQTYEIDKDNKKIIFINPDGSRNPMSYDYINETLFLQVNPDGRSLKIGLNKS